jgi:hypothetical protein
MLHALTRLALDRPAHPTATSAPDLTRGATQFGIRRASVFVETQVLADYHEIDPTVGLNVIGLSLTGRRLVLAPGGGPLEPLTVCLLRRSDGRLVEVELTFHYARGRAGESITLRRSAAQVFEPTPQELAFA